MAFSNKVGADRRIGDTTGNVERLSVEEKGRSFFTWRGGLDKPGTSVA